MPSDRGGLVQGAGGEGQGKVVTGHEEAVRRLSEGHVEAVEVVGRKWGRLCRAVMGKP